MSELHNLLTHASKVSLGSMRGHEIVLRGIVGDLLLSEGRDSSVEFSQKAKISPDLAVTENRVSRLNSHSRLPSCSLSLLYPPTFFFFEGERAHVKERQKGRV